MPNDLRWIQRFQNYSKVLTQLEEFIDKGELNKFEEQRLIQSFEYNYELAWNVIKDFYENQGETNIQGSRDAFRLAFKRGLIDNGEAWMDMIKSRVLTSHTYNLETAAEIVCKIREAYYELFKLLHKNLTALKP